MKNQILIIYDFDGTIYYNPENNLQEEQLKTWNIIPAKEFNHVETHLNYLITGRMIFSHQMKSLIEEKGYKNLQAIITCNLPKFNYPDGIFFSLYHYWKPQTIFDIITHYGGFKEFDAIIIFDDDLMVLEKFIPLARYFKNIQLIQVKLTEYYYEIKIIKTPINERILELGKILGDF